ncbi:STP1 protein [Plasmodium malariae]|uniref:STP1 protein n=1 Tax=Plasmodium malariae TaxID=5858 RepID=A0A1A8WY59_PLAMA|nr:STP1 protein [Plasmodium malariae]
MSLWSELAVQGSNLLLYLTRREYKITRNYVKNKTSSLESAKNKEEFRSICLSLANYLVNHEYVRPNDISQEKWELVLRVWLRNLFNKKTKYGQCPIIFDKNEKELLQLSYNAEDFFEINNTYLQELKFYGKQNTNNYNCKSDLKCIAKCNKYKEWFENRKSHFEKDKTFNEYKTKCRQKRNTFSRYLCDLVKHNTFRKIPKCIESGIQTSTKIESKEIERNSKEREGESTIQVSSNLPITDPSPKVLPSKELSSHSGFSSQSETISQQDASSERESSPLPSIISNPLQIEVVPSSTPIATNLIDDTQTRKEVTADVSEQSETSNSVTVHESVKIPQIDRSIEVSADLGTTQLSRNESLSFSSSAKSTPIQVPGTTNSIYYPLTGHFKKKKKLRKEVKFLKLLVPSHSWKKSHFLTYDKLENPKYNDEEIIKKIIINERNIIQNVNASMRKKEMSKTIIEVHMEVLEECKNEEMKLKEGEYLEICLKEFTEDKNGDYYNLTNDEILIENTKNTSGIQKKKILWNEWIENNRNLSEKLKETDWFNNLKNEWKRKKVYIKKSGELKKNHTGEIQKVPFLETKKNIWKLWISEKRMIIERYLEQEWCNEFTQELRHILEEYENEDTKNDISLINIQELEHKENYEEIYKYIKKKLLSKLCILVLMTILEECNKEDFIENNESMFDISINECIKKYDSDIKSNITENIAEANENILMYTGNKKIHSYKDEDRYSQELEDWIREDDAYLNAINIENEISKS